MADEDTAPPKTLREIAAEMEPKRKPTVVDGYLGDDRVLKPDENGVIWREDLDENRPRWRTERDLADELGEVREHEETDREEGEKKRVEEFEQQWAEGVEKIATPVDTEAERQALQNYNQRFAALQQAAARQEAIEQRAAQQVRWLNQSGQTHAAVIVAREALAGREAIQKEHGELTQAARQWQQHATNKAGAANLMELWRVVPELRDDAVKADFKKWLVEVERVPPRDIRREQSPQVVAAFFRRYKAQREEEYRQRAQREVGRSRLNLRGVGSDRSSEAARQSLKERGKLDDALNYLALARAERARGL